MSAQTFFTVIRSGKRDECVYATGRGQVAAQFFPQSDGMPSSFATDNYMTTHYFGMNGDRLGSIEYEF